VLPFAVVPACCQTAAGTVGFVIGAVARSGSTAAGTLHRANTSTSLLQRCHAVWHWWCTKHNVLSQTPSFRANSRCSSRVLCPWPASPLVLWLPLPVRLGAVCSQHHTVCVGALPPRQPKTRGRRAGRSNAVTVTAASAPAASTGVCSPCCNPLHDLFLPCASGHARALWAVGELHCHVLFSTIQNMNFQVFAPPKRQGNQGSMQERWRCVAQQAQAAEHNVPTSGGKGGRGHGTAMHVSISATAAQVTLRAAHCSTCRLALPQRQPGEVPSAR
jgi:hypothetical protein